MFNLDFLRRSSLMGTTLCTAPSKSYAFSTNYHACIAMPTWPRCAPPILFSPWPPYNLLPRLCLTCSFFVDSHWWVPLCVLHPQSYAISTNYHVYMQCPHDIHVHLFCFDFHKFLLRSRAAPTSNCGRGTSLFRQELVLKCFLKWKWWWFRPALCTLIRLNWANQLWEHEWWMMTGVSDWAGGKPSTLYSAVQCLIYRPWWLAYIFLRTCKVIKKYLFVTHAPMLVVTFIWINFQRSWSINTCINKICTL